MSEAKRIAVVKVKKVVIVGVEKVIIRGVRTTILSETKLGDVKKLLVSIFIYYKYNISIRKLLKA